MPVKKRAVIDKADNNGWTALMAASGKNNTELVNLLLERKAATGSANNYSYTALMIAASKDYTEVVKTLLKNGADPNKKNTDGYSAFDIAKRNGCRNSMAILKTAKQKQKPYQQKI